jgi:chromosome segregation ATPase
LENSVIENEHLVKERNELKSSSNRLHRLNKERNEELNVCKNKIDDQSAKMKQLEAKLVTAEAERQTIKEKYEEIEKVANEGVSKVRSDMMQTVVESEERYRAQIETVEKELREQRDIRSQLERQVEQLLESTGMIQMPAPGEYSSSLKEKRAKLRSSQDQAEILANTLTGLDSEDDEDGAASEDEENAPRAGLNSFAAMEELNQRLRGTSTELTSLRQQLAELERTRESLMEELVEARQAKEKLPLFEAKVKELREENREKELELMGLRDDIAEVGHLYRTQLNALLEEKAAAMSAAMNGEHKDTETSDDHPTERDEQQEAA